MLTIDDINFLQKMVDTEISKSSERLERLKTNGDSTSDLQQKTLWEIKYLKSLKIKLSDY